MTQQSSDDIYLELVALRNVAGQSLFKRLTLARNLLRDHDWVQEKTKGGGDESIALTRLEDHCFADICGALSLAEMLEIIEHIPDIRRWEKNKFNLKKMYREWKEGTKPKKRNQPEEPVILDPDALGPPFQDSERSRIATEADRLRRQLSEVHDRLHRLEEENSILRIENKRLKRALDAVNKAVGKIEEN